MKSQKVQVGVLGGGRGRSFIDTLSRHPDAEVVAVCEQIEPLRKQALELAEQLGEKPVGYADYDKFLQHELDAVVVANYATEHAPYAIRALEAGHHVLSEVLACQTVGEAVDLIEAVEASGKIYGYAENYCYFPVNQEIRRLYEKGDLGEVLHAEGEYIHDCTTIWEQLTRGERSHWRNWVPATFYCTHSTGPVMTITGTRPTKVTGYETPNLVSRQVGRVAADGSVLVCQLSNGATATFIPWANYKREPASLWVAVFGTKGSAELDRWEGSKLHVYRSEAEPHLEEYTPEMPWPEDVQIAAGHGGGDFFTVHYFLQAILERPGGEYLIDVYQGVDMTLPGIIGYRSIWEGNVTLEIPDLRKPEVRDRYRNDNWSVDPKFAGPGQPDSSCASEKIEVPDEVYERLASQWRKAQGLE